MGLKIIAIHLFLQRPATEREVSRYEYLRGLWEEFDPEERARYGFRRPQDMAKERETVRRFVRYEAESPMINEIKIEPVEIESGRPGATDRVKRVIARMFTRYAKARHEFFYVVAEFAAGKGDSMLKTIVARSQVRLWNVRH